MTSRKRASRKARIALSHRAVSDLQSIERYSVAEWGRRTANRYLEQFAAALDRIAQQPDILRLETEFSACLFFYRVKKHYLVCDLQDDLVIVLTVVHTSMDIPGRLQELEPQLIAEANHLRRRLTKRDEG